MKTPDVTKRGMLAGLVLLALVLGACGGAATAPSTRSAALPYADDLRGAVIQPPRTFTDFTIESTEGEPFRFSAHQGEVILLYFGYRTCPDVCPTTFAELRQVYLELGEPEDRVKVLFVTVDPERDTLDTLTPFTHGFHEDFIGLRAEGDLLESVKGEFGITATRREVGTSALSYLIDHTASVFLIGPDGRLQSQYLYGTDYRDILHDVQLVLDNA